MRVAVEADGTWSIYAGHQLLQGGFATSAEAWRRVDRLEGAPISPAEKRSDYIADKILKGE